MSLTSITSSASAAAVKPVTAASTAATAPLIQAAANAASARESAAYTAAIAKLKPVWMPLPLGPYPPSTDNTTFPRTGDSRLVVNASQLTAEGLAEPGKITANQLLQAEARRPKLNAFFFIGAACLVGYFVLRR